MAVRGTVTEHKRNSLTAIREGVHSYNTDSHTVFRVSVTQDLDIPQVRGLSALLSRIHPQISLPHSHSLIRRLLNISKPHNIVSQQSEGQQYSWQITSHTTFV